MSDIEIDQSADNGTVVLPAGDALCLRLPENPTTGYRWVIGRSDALQIVADSFHPGGPAIGAAGVRCLRFSSTRPGTHQLVLEKRRSWTTTTAPAESFRITVISS
jgi:inhibitor of cysteine peptidase